MTCSIRSASKTAESMPGPSMPGSKNELRVVKLNEKEDIEAYLITFKHLMTAYGVAKVKWIFKLVPQLMGKRPTGIRPRL